MRITAPASQGGEGGGIKDIKDFEWFFLLYTSQYILATVLISIAGNSWFLTSE
jgi:hypothetical protein